jgi:dihydroxy-acid dehydratase
VSDRELTRRRSGWKKPSPKAASGYLALFAALASSADRGAVLEYGQTE